MLESADALNTIWLLTEGNYTRDMISDDKDPDTWTVQRRWEGEWINRIVDNSGYKDGGDDNTNGDKVPGGKPSGLMVDALADFR